VGGGHEILQGPVGKLRVAVAALDVRRVGVDLRLDPSDETGLATQRLRDLGAPVRKKSF